MIGIGCRCQTLDMDAPITANGRLSYYRICISAGYRTLANTWGGKDCRRLFAWEGMKLAFMMGTPGYFEPCINDFTFLCRKLDGHDPSPAH